MVEGKEQSVFVAMIKKDTDDQPFRVVVEKIESQETAMAEVNAWIAAREAEDAQAEAEKAQVAEEAKKDEVLNSLNAGLSEEKPVEASEAKAGEEAA